MAGAHVSLDTGILLPYVAPTNPVWGSGLKAAFWLRGSYAFIASAVFLPSPVCFGASVGQLRPDAARRLPGIDFEPDTFTESFGPIERNRFDQHTFTEPRRDAALRDTPDDPYG